MFEKLKIINLSCGYNKKSIISKLNLELNKNEVLVLIGANGSGKTTFLKTLSGIITPIDGSLELINDSKIIDLKRLSFLKRARYIGRVIQNETPSWSVSVKNYIEAGLFPEQSFSFDLNIAQRARIKNAIDELGLKELENAVVTKISGGEFKRVLIARLIVQNPQIYLMDEAIGDLDPSWQIKVLGIIRKIASNGNSVILTIHDLNLASIVADRIALFSENKMIALGTAKEIIKNEILEKAYNCKIYIEKHPEIDRPQVIYSTVWEDNIKIK